MSVLRRLRTAWDALRQLGFEPVALAGLYRFGLITGHYRRVTPAKDWEYYDAGGDAVLLKTPPMPDAQALLQVIGTQIDDLICEADEICRGKVRLFGADPVPLNFTPILPLSHWTAYETGRVPWGIEDVKFIWEPARLGWALTLARAYAATGNTAYLSLCHQQLQEFLTVNPPSLGPNWASAQEVGLRIIVLALVGAVLKDSPIPSFTPSPQAAIAAHAERIPPTLVYARAQNNNHLLSEAVGLYSAGVMLPGHPKSAEWCTLGWKWANHCFQTQIAADGTYNQHSINYQRMMLQLALWFKRMADLHGDVLPAESLVNLARATRWLIARLDPISGRVPNLGHNDGGYILPLASGGFHDYRPVTQAASRAFLNQSCLPPGVWDEMSLWFGPATQPATPVVDDASASAILRSATSRASLRAAHYTTRPGQADQLHVDVWWHGEPVTLDAGTFQYNTAPPWENALASTLVHNTVSVNAQDQMRRAGRFLWLDWAQADWLPAESAGTLMASHDGYARRFHIRHCRTLSNPSPDGWLIRDWLEVIALAPVSDRAPITFTLHWLLPNLPYQLEGNRLHLTSPRGEIRIGVECSTGNPSFQLVRAGEVLSGSPTASPILGWYSPTYGVKVPALSLRVLIQSTFSAEFTTRIELIPSDTV